MLSWATGGASERRSRPRDGRDTACRGSEMTALHVDGRPAPPDPKLCGSLAIVGGFDGTHVGGSLWRAARHFDIDTAKFDVSAAGCRNRVLHAALWRLGGGRPPGMHRFS